MQIKKKWVAILSGFLLLFVSNRELNAQTRSTAIRGFVKTETDQPMEGVTVLLRKKHSDVKTSTKSDAKGLFEFIEIDSGLFQIELSAVGYETQILDNKRVIPGNTTSLIVRLKPATNVLSEAVVIGYGTQRRRDVTGAITSLTPDSKVGQSVVSADQMLQGRVGGINVTSTSGVPGAGVRISVRGVGSINGSNEPLYVVDGIPIINSDPSPLNGQNFGGGVSNPLSLINPEDIASFDILKDAAAAAIYGSRATNGVVLITTKKGKSGTPEVDLSSYFGFQSMPDNIETVSTETYFEVLNEARTNYNLQNNLSAGMVGFLTPMQDPRTEKIADTDWVGLITDKNAPVNNNNLSIRGGNDYTKYFSSINYMDQSGTIKTSRFKRYSGRLNLDQKISERVSLGSNVLLSGTVMNRIPSDLAGNAILLRALEQRPYDVPYQADGSYSIGGADILRHNGVQSLNEQQSNNKSFRALATMFVNVKITKGFSYKGTASIDYNNTQDYLALTQNHPYGAPAGVVYDFRSMNKTTVFDNVLNYDKAWENLNLQAMAGHSFQKTDLDIAYIDGRDFPSPSFGYINAAARINQAYTNWTGNALESYFGRVNLNYLERYLFTATYRVDGSSKFATDKKYGAFPSASAAWLLSNEQFLQDVPWLNSLKLRLSYGVTGNQEGINDFASFALVNGGQNYNQQVGLATVQPSNDQLVWERSNQSNLGIDGEFLNKRLSISFDYFIKNTENLLFNVPERAYLGFTTSTVNIGSIRNRGFETTINAQIMDKAFKWNTGFNISAIENEVTSLVNTSAIVTDAYHALQIGQPVGAFYMLEQIGIYQRDEDVPTALYGIGVRAGDIQYRDVNDDGNINADDRVIAGSALPSFFGGLTNSFAYKQFDLTVFCNFSYGNKIFSYWRGNSFGDGIDGVGGNQFNMLAETTEARWTGEGTSNEVPRAIWPTANGNYNKQISTRYLEDGSYFRVRNITLGYTKQLNHSTSLKALRFYASGQNLLTFTRYMGFDPEVSTSLDARNLGLDAGTVPQSKMFLIGINAKF